MMGVVLVTKASLETCQFLLCKKTGAIALALPGLIVGWQAGR